MFAVRNAMTTATIDVTKIVPEPSRLREAIARNMRERRALELALRASEFIATEVQARAGHRERAGT